MASKQQQPDADGYVSAEDEDFVYGEDIAADSFEDSCEKEARLAGELAGGKRKGKRKRPSAAGAGTGRNMGGRGGGLVLSDDEGGVPPELLEIQRKEAEERAALEAAAMEEQERAKKSRIDDLWAELNGGSAPTPTPSTSAPATTAPSTTASNTVAVARSDGDVSTGGKVDSSLAALLGTDEPVAVKPQKTAAQIAAELLAAKDKGDADGGTQAKEGEVVIKETYDFAGRKVEVEKAVAANSQAAKKFSAKQSGSGIDRLLASLGKKKQMTTTTKSRLDWDKHTIESGTKDDLQNAAKDGYLEKQAFLSRAEMREFEQRRTVNRKRLGISDD